MAGASLFTLLDDISVILDDVAVLSKVAAKKTAGVVGDDLALNANQLAGIKADRELPIVFEVAKGSMVNKAIIIPIALGLSAFAPALITPLLMAGGAFLCYEGVEKVIHSKDQILKPFKRILGSKEIADDNNNHKLSDHEANIICLTPEELVIREKEKIKGAVKTDFILSAEIMVIVLGSAAAGQFVTQALTLTTVGVAMTVGVYGLVAGIVKLDDIGMYLKDKGEKAKNKVMESFGDGMLSFAPKLMKTLSIGGTIAMFTVGGGILAHGVGLHLASGVTGILSEIGVGLAAGAGLVAGHHVAEKIGLIDFASNTFSKIKAFFSDDKKEESNEHNIQKRIDQAIQLGNDNTKEVVLSQNSKKAEVEQSVEPKVEQSVVPDSVKEKISSIKNTQEGNIPNKMSRDA